MTPEQLQAALPYATPERVMLFAAPLSRAMDEAQITTAARRAAFLAQAAHESGSLRYLRELADGSDYEGRADLGNVYPGDGVRYRGRGILQVTGRSNYASCGEALGLDLIESPELLETIEGACRSAAWFWGKKRLNAYADSDSFGALTKAINGGYTGLDDRLRAWLKARRACGI
jgi:putative chitinase